MDKELDELELLLRKTDRFPGEDSEMEVQSEQEEELQERVLQTMRPPSPIAGSSGMQTSFTCRPQFAESDEEQGLYL